MKDKIEQFIERWCPDVDDFDTHAKFNAEFDSLLKEVAEDAYDRGHEDALLDLPLLFADYWKSVTDKIK